MSGSKFLLDTNFVIGLLKGNEQVDRYLKEHSINVSECAYSFITRIELLSYPRITESEIAAITSLLNAMQYLPMTPAIENTTIKIRRQYTLKVPRFHHCRNGSGGNIRTPNPRSSVGQSDDRN